MSYWKPYEPTAAAPWNLPRVVHLHRRVRFGATWNEIQRDLADAPHSAVDRILQGTSRIAETPSTFANLSETIGQSAVDASDPSRLKAWWVFRCLSTPDPLAERLTLMWHQHFATSLVKVRDVRLMYQQNLTLRRLGRGPFPQLLSAMLADPALLMWLDAGDNRKDHPNENLARELLELFTLGIGQYTERDVRETARALTGLTVEAGRLRLLADTHDSGSKTILGYEGPCDSSQLVQLLAEQDATSRRLAWRLCSELMAESTFDADSIAELAAGLKAHDLRIEWGVETILRSAKFFDRANLQSRISDPLNFLLGPLLSLECFRNPPSTLIIADLLRRMGQDLFLPPNVGGWPGGRAWLSTQTVIARANAITTFLEGRCHLPAEAWNPVPLLQRHQVPETLPKVIEFFGELCFGGIEQSSRQRIEQNVDPRQDPSTQFRQALALLLTRPQAQLH